MEWFSYMKTIGISTVFKCTLIIEVPCRFIKQFGKKASRGRANLAEGKIGLAVQFVSNCHSSSRREFYVRELQREIPVDVYGDCGDFKCPKVRQTL